MPAPTTIETKRLRLRPLSPEDLGPLWAIWSEDAVREHLITQPANFDEFRRMFDDMAAQRSAAGALWVVADRTSGEVLGRCGFYRYGDAPPELAILLTETRWGAGLASEAMAAALGFGIEDLGWPEVVAVARPGNARVLRTLETLGFSPRQTVELRGASAIWFGVTAADWRKRP